MAAPRNRRHILVREDARAESFTPPRRKIDIPSPPVPGDRRAFASRLHDALETARQESQQARDAISIDVHGATTGLYIQFESVAGFDLKLESLENKAKGIELVAVQALDQPGGQPPIQLATVLVPDDALGHFFDRFRQYAEEDTKKGQRKHAPLLERIGDLRRATLRALWTDDPSAYPIGGQRIWWEVWLRRRDGDELARLLDFAAQQNIRIGERRLAFDDRIVVLAYATPQQLSASVDVLSDLAEVRKAKESVAFFVDIGPTEQAAWAQDLERRIVLPPAQAPAVCLLDTGITVNHPLLQRLIDPSDAMAVDASWGGHDNGGGPSQMGHGTEMAGLASYGDLAPILASSAPVQLRHRLESVKILPPTGANDPEHYGAITVQAAMLPEIKSPQRSRVYSMAITATDERDRGRPTSWSAAVDALAVGRSFDPTTQGLVYLGDAAPRRRLFVISAGNVSSLDNDHLARSDIEPIHDPAHAWNALTVGAYTEKAVIHDPSYSSWRSIAPIGELSPHSTTSVSFQPIWPIKPDVVMEGGNVATDGSTFDDSIPDLGLLSLHYNPAQRLFVHSWATSAATAQASRIAARIQHDYPDYWPETVRALIVHSARWTRTMNAHLTNAGNKTGRGQLVRRYGFGVPSLQRALRSANDALTLVVQSRIRPFDQGKMREIHFHHLPWPIQALAELGQASVSLRVTLSYFVEPNPGRRGWKKKHRYASHGLRFDVKGATETDDDFRKRLNQQALDDDEERPDTGGDGSAWYLGPRVRDKGSIHSDIWSGSAADLAQRNVVAVYPVTGWWKEQRQRDRSALGAPYSLIISIESDAADVDIWTPVAEQVNIPTEIDVGIE